MADENIPKLNAEQRHAYDRIFSAVMDDEPDLFFLLGPAETGKTFVYNTLCYALCAEGKIVLCVASSGIAAILLIGGRTSHSTSVIPIKISEGKACSVKSNSVYGDLFRRVDLIIWDEVPMQSKLCQEAVDLTFRDCRTPLDPANADKPLGGVSVVFGGDFMQILLVIVKGTREQIVGDCIQRSHLWSRIEPNIMRLHRNQRFDGANDADREFASWLIEVGKGRNSNETGMVALPQSMRIPHNSEESLIQALYPGLAGIPLGQNNDTWFAEQTILAARNDDVSALNTATLQTFPGHSQIFHSADSIAKIGSEAPQETGLYPVEYLNSLDISGMPVSKLELKVGCPIMLLCNLNPRAGLCNGTRGVVTRMTRRVLEML